MAVYTVQRGDTLVDIARTIYGDPRRWRDVARLFGRDPATYGTSWAIQPGQTVTAPADTPYAQAQAAAAPAPEPAAEPAAEPAPATREENLAGRPSRQVVDGERLTYEELTPQPTPVAVVEPVVEPAPAPAPAPAPMEQAPAEPPPPTADQESAYQIITDALSSYGLEGLGDFVTGLVFDEGIVTQAGLMTRIRETETYRERFRGNELRRAAGFNALSEAEYIGMENTFAQYMRASGLPAGFYDQPEDFRALIGANVSAGEFAERINQGYEAVANADPEVIAEMRRLYNIGDGELAAYFLDPERATPMLLRQARAAQVAGGAAQGGFGVTAAEAEMLATEGITQQQARAGFAAIAEGDLFELTTEEQVAGEQALTREEQIGATFGTDPRAAQRLRRQQRRRTAAFEAGGRFAGQGAEITGLR